ncbi:MAG: SH3 domain-containing protein [Pyrinomonadaceae bacterium]
MAETGTTTATQLNFRSSPDGSANNLIGKLPKGTRVEILEDRGDWLRVSANGREGFVSEGFVARDEEEPEPDDDATVGAGADLSAGAPNAAAAGDAASQPTAGQPAASSSSLKPGPAPAPGSCKFVGNKAVTPDGKPFATRFKLGVFTNGMTSIGAFVAAHPGLFPDVSPSRLRVMQAVSVNEGKLEAINTWDNAFLTFGCFQWTVGAGDGAGELPSLLDRLKKKDASVFQKYFGQFGLDVAMPQPQPDVLPTGFFTLNGTPLRTPQQKSQLRTLDWAYRFWLVG